MRVVQRIEIEDAKWNATVLKSTHPRHYSLTYYLDACTNDWLGMIWGDYEVVWPLPLKRFPVKRMFQPLLIQQLGPTINDSFNDSILKDGLNYIKGNFSSFSVKFNDTLKSLGDLETESHLNIELDLNREYDQLEKSYNRNVRSNLKKAEKQGLWIDREDASFHFVIDSFKDSRRSGLTTLDKRFYLDVQAIYEAFLKRGQASCFIAKMDGSPIAGILILRMENRILNFFTGATEKARGVGAMHALIDHIIQAYSKSAVIFDFEGSDDENLRFFYQSFGGVEKVYLQVYSNKMIWPLNRILK